MKALATFLVVGGTAALLERRAEKAVWRVMVPERDNNGQRFRDVENQQWERTVINISGGWTEHSPARGAWADENDGRVQIEDMRPVDILCTRSEIQAIIEMTRQHYRQKVVFAYKVSEDVIWEDGQKQRKLGMVR